VLNDARLRVFINLENAISLFLASPEGFEANLTALADILSIVITSPFEQLYSTTCL
ncbi:hypothetical protein IAF33_19410, partial [Acinetobacter baumannii]|nr:hypothetical protein [Acinetobacter baumannii]